MANGIFKKIEKIQDAVGILPKDGRGPSTKGGFAYITYDSIAEAVRKLLVENSVIVRPEVVEYDSKAEIISNRSVVHTTVVVKYIYTDVADGSEYVSTVAGEGSDIGGDTATRKAFSQARKIDLLQTFTIVTGEPVDDSDGAESAEIPRESKAAVAAADAEDLVAEVGKLIKGSNGALESDQVSSWGDLKFPRKAKNRTWFDNPDDLTALIEDVKKFLADGSVPEYVK